MRTIFDKVTNRARELVTVRFQGGRSARMLAFESEQLLKFTERARKVLTLAQEEARNLNYNYVGTEHLLLGLLREGDGVGGRVLASSGIKLDEVREKVKFVTGTGNQPVSAKIELTPRTKRVIELAADEARKLNHTYIGTEHLLLGLLREGEGIAAGVLAGIGVEFELVRAEVMRILNQ